MRPAVSRWFSIKKVIKKGADKGFEKNLLSGNESDPKIVLYKNMVTAEWKKAKVRTLIEEARKLSGRKKKRRIQKAYDQGEKAIRKAMNGVASKYETGATRKTWYCKNSIEIRKLRSESRYIMEAWRRMEAEQITAAMSVERVQEFKPKTGTNRNVGARLVRGY
jgi:bisphosphoglycerate-independent phosphoglycerate mutase (AlkP superfamily)